MSNTFGDRHAYAGTVPSWRDKKVMHVSPFFSMAGSYLWDLPELDRSYSAFCEEFSTVLEAWPAQRGPDAEGESGGEAFADYVRVLTAWRRLPYLDPGLAPELLPPDWSGVRAAEVFFALHHRLATPAHRFVEAQGLYRVTR